MRSKLGEQDTVLIAYTVDHSGARIPAAVAALTHESAGISGAPRYPDVVPDFPKGTAYLSDVAGTSGHKAAGGQVIEAAFDAAKKTGARALAFYTQSSSGAYAYSSLGAHLEGQPAPAGAKLPGLTVTRVQVSTDAAEMLKAQFGRFLDEQQQSRPGKPLSEEVQALRRAVDGKTIPQLRQHLEGLSQSELFRLSTQVPGGVMLTSYYNKFAPTPWRAVRWTTQDAFRSGAAKVKTVRDRARERVDSTLGRFQRPLDAAKRPFSAVNWRINPYALSRDIEPGPLRRRLQTIGDGVRFGVREGAKTGGATLGVAIAAQTAVGAYQTRTDDDNLIRPFNGMRGSRSVGVYFPLTGTMAAAWATGPNRRGPWPLDENGLMPLARVSAPMTDPKGPKGAGFLSAARLAPVGEVNAGIRWFGSNSGPSALSAMSWRPMPVNFNVRGDVPVQKGAATNLSFLGSLTALMPSISHAFYLGRGGVVIRTLHVTMGGSLQTAALSPAARASAFRSGKRFTLGANGVSTGTGLFFTLNPAYGHPDPSFYN